MPKFSSNTSINPAGIDNLIREHGEWFWYFKGSRCPCGTEINKPDFACPNCEGLGHFYPEPPTWMRGLITKIDISREPFGIPGFVIPGDLTMTVRPVRGKLHQVYDFDMIQLTMIDGIPLEGEDILADPSGTDKLQHPCVELKSAYGTNPFSSSSPVTIVKYTAGLDFSLVPPTGNNKYSQFITWLTDNRPDPGSKYVVQYSSQPMYIIFNPPMPHVERGTDLGQAVILRKRSIVLAGMFS